MRVPRGSRQQQRGLQGRQGAFGQEGQPAAAGRAAVLAAPPAVVCMAAAPPAAAQLAAERSSSSLEPAEPGRAHRAHSTQQQQQPAAAASSSRQRALHQGLLSTTQQPLLACCDARCAWLDWRSVPPRTMIMRMRALLLFQCSSAAAFSARVGFLVSGRGCTDARHMLRKKHPWCGESQFFI